MFSQDLASRVRQNPPLDLLSISAWILQLELSIGPSTPRPSSTIIRLLLQAVIYLVWKERNSRIFTNVDRMIRDRLLSFPAQDPNSPSLLEFYFGCINLIT
ncbi:hypothetical protein EUTSA_v10017884mg [Eutrema salsugineum]|uniref:Reverse transcriptase zinc-binding domain-containing protein n=1 Tax=Eutrema salsugineum TaxID=72664 RepID=V4M900_EUTSA|nr:hypothetical protein EUTSA_v10017884mg [Eutrema salsugineum]